MPAILVTGRPGSGKTTLVRKVLETLQPPAAGFYTRETRGGQSGRTGFELVTLDGEVATLASVLIGGPHRVGRYGVDIDALEQVGVPALEAAVEAGHLVVIDEIGKMELLSRAFRAAVMEALRRRRVIFGAIMQAPNAFADELKTRPDTRLFEVTERNRDEVRGVLEKELRAVLDRPGL